MSARGLISPTKSIAPTTAWRRRRKGRGVTTVGPDTSIEFDAMTPAKALVDARRAHRALNRFPGPLPPDVAAAFGNNAGLILGSAVPNWRDRADDGPTCEVHIDSAFVGRGAPSSIAGGPAASLAFLLGLCAERSRPLKRGQLVTTGAASGI